MSFPALKHSNYRLFFIGHGCSLIGTWMQTIATSWLVYRLTGSTAMLGITAFSSQILTFFLSPFAGVWIEEHDKKQVLFWAQLFSLFQAIILAVLVLSNTVLVWEIIALNLLLGAINAFDMPTRHALVLELVDNKKEHLQSAIALNSSLFNAARVIGPMVAGIIISTSGEGSCFVINALSYLFILFALLKIKTNFIKPEIQKIRVSVTEKFKEGLRYVMRVPSTLFALISLGIMSLFGMSFIVLLPVFASTIFHGTSKEFGMLTSASGIGAVIAALYIANEDSPHHLLRKIIYPAIFYFIGGIIFSFTSSFYFALVIMFLMGIAGVIQISSINTLIQLDLPYLYRGRVMSIYTMVFVGTSPLSAVLTGYLAEHLGPGQTVLLNELFALFALLILVLSFHLTKKLIPNSEGNKAK